MFFEIVDAIFFPVIVTSDDSFIFNWDLSSINMINAKPSEPVLIRSPSFRIVPAFNELKPGISFFSISTEPKALVVIAIR